MHHLRILTLLLLAGSLQAAGLRTVLMDPAFDLDSEQRVRVENLLEEHELELIDLRASRVRAELALQQAVRKGEESISRLEKRVDEVAEARASLEKKRLRTRMEVRKVLSKEQRELFDRLQPAHPPRAGLRKGPRVQGPQCHARLHGPPPAKGRHRGLR